MYYMCNIYLTISIELINCNELQISQTIQLVLCYLFLPTLQVMQKYNHCLVGDQVSIREVVIRAVNSVRTAVIYFKSNLKAANK